MFTLDHLLKSLQAITSESTCDSDTVIGALNELIDPRTANFSHLSSSTKEFCNARGGRLDELGAVTAHWMVELDTRDSKQEGISLLRWLDARGCLAARYQLAQAFLTSRDAAVHAQAVPMMEELLAHPGCHPDLRRSLHASLASCHGTGRGTPESPKKAIEHLKQGASMGDPSCALSLGSLYDQKPESQRLLPLDYAMAAHYYQIAADAGCLHSLSALANLHLAGFCPEACHALGRSMMQEAYSKGLSVAGSTLKLISEYAERMPLDQACREVARWMMAGKAQAMAIMERMNLPKGLDLTSQEACANPEIVFAVQMMEVITALRISGPLQNDDHFSSVLERVSTHQDRKLLSNDKDFWIQVGVRFRSP